MTNVTQTLTAPVDLRPLQSSLPQEIRNTTAEPYALLVHTEDSVAIDDIGVGDEQRVRLTLPLPSAGGTGYILRRAIATMRSGTDAPSNYEGGKIEIYTVSTIASTSGQSTQIDFPMGQTIMLDFASLEAPTTYQLGAGDNENVVSVNPGGGFAQSGPGMLVYGGKTDPVFQLVSRTASTEGYTLSYLFEWLCFTQPQTVHTGLYWNIPVRQ